MKINSLHISSFGKLQDTAISFTGGMNIYPGDNEHGKSTILSFIRAMFYGFSQRGSSLPHMKDNDRRKFIPWNGKSVGGSIEFTHEEKTYLLEKKFLKRKSEDSVSLTLQPSGRKVDPGQKEVGDFLFGISESEFVNTVFVGQMSANIVNTDKETDDVSARLANLAGTGTELFSHEEIKNRLSSASAKLQALRGAGGLIPRLEEELNCLAEKERLLDASKVQSDLLYDEIVAGREKEQILQSELNRISQKLDEEKKQTGALQAQLQEQEILVQTALQRKQMEQEQAAEKEELEKRNREHLMQRESLRRQLSEEFSGIENEILRLHKEKLEDQVRSDELTAGLDAMIHNQKEKCKVAGALYEKQTAEATLLEEEILTLSSEMKPLLQAREEIRKGRTEIMGRTYPAKRYEVMLVLIFGLTMVLFIITRSYIQLIGILLLFFAAGIYAVNRAQLRSMDQKIVSLNTVHEAKMKLFESASAFSYDAEADVKDAEMRLEELLIQKQRLQEDILKDSQHREYLLKMTKDRRETCKARLEQFVDDPEELQQKESATERNTEKTDELDPKEGSESADFRQTEDMMQTIRLQLASGRREFSGDLGREEQLRTEISACRVDVARKETNRENLMEQTPDQSLLLEQRAMLLERLDMAKTYHRALLTAQSVLDEAFSEMENVFAPQVNERAGAYLSKLTGGIYSALHVDRSFSVELASDGEYEYHPIDFYSGGTVDQVYFALRLAIADLVQTSADKMPLLLDDAFIQYDDSRALYGLALLRELSFNRQVILFTCQRRMDDMYAATFEE